MARATVAGVTVLICTLLLLPATAAAQVSSSGIAGVVRDTSGAVLPGVTVEASSPALIEKVRSVVTDEQGQYKIVDVRFKGNRLEVFDRMGTLKRVITVVPPGSSASGDVKVERSVSDIAFSRDRPVEP